jgi:hypothetical protein
MIKARKVAEFLLRRLHFPVDVPVIFIILIHYYAALASRDCREILGKIKHLSYLDA